MMVLLRPVGFSEESWTVGDPLDDCAAYLESIEATPLWRLGDPYPEDWAPVEVLHLADHNPRRGDVEKIRTSIEENGWFGKLLVQVRCERQGGQPRIVAGNHRLLAGLDLGMDHFPVMWIDVDDHLGDKILLADNRYAELAQWDDFDLVTMLKGLDGDFDGTGFTDVDLEVLLASLNAKPDDEQESTGRLSSDQMKCQIGTVSFTISRDEWAKFEVLLTQEVGTRHEDLVAEMRGRLGL